MGERITHTSANEKYLNNLSSQREDSLSDAIQGLALNFIESATVERIHQREQIGGLGDRLSQNGVNYTLDLNSGLTQVLSDGTISYTYGLGRISQQSGNASEYFLGDALGSVRQMTDQTGTITYAASYDPYGVVTQSSGVSQSAYGYTGEQQDVSGMVYLRARYYSPYLNQFIQPDTIVPDPRTPADWNRYAYVRNNPINYTDPSGKSPVPDAEYEACVSSSKLSRVIQSVKESVCGMISELEDKNYLNDNTPDADHIEAAYRSAKDAHTYSTAYHILHDFVSIEDLRKTPIDSDGNVWYKEEWDAFYCAGKYPTGPWQFSSLVYLDYLVKKNASEKGAAHIGGRNPFKKYIFTPFGSIADVTYAMEGYRSGNPERLPNSLLPEISKHIYGLAVDISIDVEAKFTDIGYTEVDEIASEYHLRRPYNQEDYISYTDDETREWWHFESFGFGR
jgi:RHS repeat-associated protein